MMSVPNGHFEFQSDGTPVPQWTGEGPDRKGVDRASQETKQNQWAHCGTSNAFIEASSTGQWNALTQGVSVTPKQTVEVSAYVWTSAQVKEGYFGVRTAGSPMPYKEVKFAALSGGYQRLSVQFWSGPASGYTIFVGFWSPGGFSWLVVDDIDVKTL
jgi:hypothetical protein